MPIKLICISECRMLIRVYNKHMQVPLYVTGIVPSKCKSSFLLPSLNTEIKYENIILINVKNVYIV